MILIMVKDIYLFWISSFYFVHQNTLYLQRNSMLWFNFDNKEVFYTFN